MSSAFQEPSADGSDAAPPTQSFWVSPLHPLKAEEIALPGPDQIGIAIVQPYISCFTTTEEFDEARFIPSLQAATAGLIWEIPSLAGRVEWEDEARHRIKVVIPEDPKCEVRIRYLPQYDAKELEANHWPMRAFHHDEICLQATPPTAVNTYNFGVQANIIRNGVILTLHNNHVILDGAAQCLSLAVFAHHMARAMAGKPATASELVPPEALDKSAAFGSHPARPILDWKDIKETVKLPADEARMAFLQRIMNNNMSGWLISPANQKKLQAKYQDPSKPKLSQSSLLATWLWRTVTKARRLDSNVATRLIMPVQARGRLEDLHQNYSGNAIVFSRAKATVEEVQNLGTHELGERVTQSVNWWTPERIREFWGSVEEADDMHKYENSCSTSREDPGTDLEITNMINFPFYHLRWGKGLHISRYRQVNIPFTCGWSGFTPRLRDGTLELFLFMTREVIERIMDDPEFMQYVEVTASNDEDLVTTAMSKKKAIAKL